MGLVISHNAFNGSQQTFHYWRTEIAGHDGIDLPSMEGYTGGGKKWDEFQDRDLVPLLKHSDIKGILTPDECRRVKNGLEKILPKVSDEYMYSMKEITIQFIEGCKNAIEKEENLEFSG